MSAGQGAIQSVHVITECKHENKIVRPVESNTSDNVTKLKDRLNTDMWNSIEIEKITDSLETSVQDCSKGPEHSDKFFSKDAVVLNCTEIRKITDYPETRAQDCSERSHEHPENSFSNVQLGEQLKIFSEATVGSRKQLADCSGKNVGCQKEIKNCSLEIDEQLSNGGTESVVVEEQSPDCYHTDSVVIVNRVGAVTMKVPVTVNGHKVDAIVDTGAAVSGYSQQTFFSISENELPELRQTNECLVVAEKGKTMKTYGVADISLCIGGHSLTCPVFVAPICDDFLLGGDIIHQCCHVFVGIPTINTVYMYIIDFTSNHVSQALFTPAVYNHPQVCTTTQQTASRQAGDIGPALGRCLVFAGLSCQQTHLATRRTRCACSVANTIRFISNFHKYMCTPISASSGMFWFSSAAIILFMIMYVYVCLLQLPLYYYYHDCKISN